MPTALRRRQAQKFTALRDGNGPGNMSVDTDEVRALCAEETLLVDAHAHIDWYKEALADALGMIERHRIVTMSVAMDVPSYLKTREIARSCPHIIPTFGIHPWEAPRYADSLHVLDDHLRETPVIGEAGLDFRYVKDATLYPGQMRVFEYQCAWAQRLGKPMNLHTRGAESEVLEMIRRYRITTPIIHWYGGPVDLIEAYLAEGATLRLASMS